MVKMDTKFKIFPQKNATLSDSQVLVRQVSGVESESRPVRRFPEGKANAIPGRTHGQAPEMRTRGNAVTAREIFLLCCIIVERAFVSRKRIAYSDPKRGLKK